MSERAKCIFIKEYRNGKFLRWSTSCRALTTREDILDSLNYYKTKMGNVKICSACGRDVEVIGEK